MSAKENKTGMQKGLVVSYFGKTVAVEAEDAKVYPCQLHRNQALPVVGDQVLWQLGPDGTGVVCDILPRASIVARGDAKGQQKPIAANIDMIVLMMAPSPVFSHYLVDRYLIAAELLAIPAMIVINKADLLNETTRTEAMAQLAPYQQMGYPALLASARTHEGIDALSAVLKGKAAILVGPSGVGKSSTIMAMGYTEAIRVSPVSAKGVGKHTTTVSRLYHLPQGGSLIDSPGVREFNLWPVTRQEILAGFKEFKAHLQGCRFRDCLHVAEPDCAVQSAVQQGKIAPSRYANYQTLVTQAGKK